MRETNKRWNERQYCDNVCRSHQLSADGTGENNYFFNKHLVPHNYGKTSRFPLIARIRGLKEYRQWKQGVINRDAYICVKCNNIGSQKDVHHIKGFMVLFGEFLKTYNQFSPLDDMKILLEIAKTHDPFWDINNGTTLCDECHKLSHKRIYETA